MRHPHFLPRLLILVCTLTMVACSEDQAESTGRVRAKTNAQVASLSVVSTTPESGATSVALDAPILVSFNLPLDPSVVNQDLFSMNPPVAGEVTLEQENKTLRFVPNGSWSTLATYKVTLAKSALKGVEGESLDEDVSWSFSTAARQMIKESGVYTDGDKRATVEVREVGGSRTYVMETSATLRDNAVQKIEFSEQQGQPVLRTGHDMFDALFAMSVEEARQNSVESISDGAFNQGQGVPCSCFETGEKWNYVWTRDTAYAVDLGLDLLDPERAKRSLLFKLSGRKGTKSDPQIIQDTGSGGSWPVSTDRVVWALGAWSVSHALSPSSRQDFMAKAYPAIANTIEADRQAVFDPQEGLYLGEQSFLDWREQSYPTWTAQDTVHIAMSRTLSTNVGHWVLLDVGAKLATEQGEMERAGRWRTWADELASSIRKAFWIEEDKMLSAMKTTELDLGVLRKYELLGQSLAVLSGVADANQSSDMVAAYPRVPKGPAVLWPQQPDIPIYHNRGIWPFVTAYGALAARKVGNGVVFEHDLESLIRGAALNLSNMENFEFTTQEPWYEDGDFSGPIVNSKRQLWSVAGYFGAVVKGVFGMETAPDKVRFQPFITPSIHQRWFSSTQTPVTLQSLPFWGKRVAVAVTLPKTPPSSAMKAPYVVSQVTLNGKPVDEKGWVSREQWDALEGEEVTFEVTLEVDKSAQDSKMNLVEDLDDWQNLWAPKEPVLESVGLKNDKVVLSLKGSGEPDVALHVWRNGEEVAADVQEGEWVDPNSSEWSSVTYCYSVEARLKSSGHRSHHTPPQCYWGEGDSSRVEVFDAMWFEPVSGGKWSNEHGRDHYGDWGDPGHELTLAAWHPKRSGTYALQMVYGNGSGGFNTGITTGVKEVEVKEAVTGTVLATSVMVFPQLGQWSRWGESSFVKVDGVDASKVYRVTLRDAWNMSYFDHFTPYNGPAGGGPDVFNRVNLQALKMLPLSGAEDTSRSDGTLVALNGSGDLGKFPVAQQYDTEAKVEPWSKWATAWDKDFVYFSMVTKAFEDPFTPLMIYLGEQGSAPSSGMPYREITPMLPFTPQYVLGARRTSNDALSGEPWNGLWRRDDQGEWRRQIRLVYDTHVWVAGDQHTLSIRIARAQLVNLDPSKVAISVHLPLGQPGNEWKEMWPADATPWMAGGGAGVLDWTKGN